jgi:hypothetical protein
MKKRIDGDDSLYLWVSAGLTKEAMNMARDEFMGRYDQELTDFLSKRDRDYKRKHEDHFYFEGDHEQGLFTVPRLGTCYNGRYSEARQAEMVEYIVNLVQSINNLEKTVKPKVPQEQGLPYSYYCKEGEKADLTLRKDHPDHPVIYEVWSGLVKEIVCKIFAGLYPRCQGREVSTSLLLSNNEDQVAACIKKGGDITIAINPEKATSFSMLVAAACHEVVHLARDYHNEEFASLLTCLLAGIYSYKFEELESRWNEYQQNV